MRGVNFDLDFRRDVETVDVCGCDLLTGGTGRYSQASKPMDTLHVEVNFD